MNSDALFRRTMALTMTNSGDAYFNNNPPPTVIHRTDNMQSQLRSIKSAAEAVTNLVAPLVVPPSRIASIEIPTLRLVSPPHLRPQFQNIDGKIAAEITQAFDKATIIARNRFALKFEESCRQLLATEGPPGCLPLPCLFEKLRCTFQDSYERNLRSWSDELIPTAVARFTSNLPHTTKSVPSPTRQISMNKKATFHHENVPLLETYFERNAFPSQADKALLAKKSEMTYRQIDVWFQNRRSRAKKNGKALKKLPSHEEPKMYLKSLVESMGGEITPVVDSDVSEYQWQYDSDDNNEPVWTPRYPPRPRQPDLLNAVSPPHAFPSVYPPICGYDPFPAKEGKFTFPSPVWMRHPAKPVESRPMVDLEKLIEDFTRLTVRDGIRRRLVKKHLRKSTDSNQTLLPQRDRSAATFFITTRPLPAPIPALVRPIVPTRVILPSQFTSLPHDSSPGGTRSSPTPSPQSRSPTPLSPAPGPAPTENTARRRKIAPLPRRAPAGMGVSRHGDIVVHPERLVFSPASSSSHLSSSRKSSFASDSSSQSGLSSDNSSASSVVVTPESSPILLPGHLSSPSIHQDFSYLHGFPNDPYSGRLSPMQGIRLDFTLADDLHDAAAKRRLDFTFHSPTRPLDLTNCS